MITVKAAAKRLNMAAGPSQLANHDGGAHEVVGLTQIAVELGMPLAEGLSVRRNY